MQMRSALFTPLYADLALKYPRITSSSPSVFLPSYNPSLLLPHSPSLQRESRPKQNRETGAVQERERSGRGWNDCYDSFKAKIRRRTGGGERRASRATVIAATGQEKKRGRRKRSRNGGDGRFNIICRLLSPFLPPLLLLLFLEQRSPFKDSATAAGATTCESGADSGALNAG